MGEQENFSQSDKKYLPKNSIANIILNGEMLGNFPLRLGKILGCLLQRFTLKLPWGSRPTQYKVKVLGIRKEEIKLSYSQKT